MIDGYDQCDGDDLGGTECADLDGYVGGELACTDTCSFDTSGCEVDTEALVPLNELCGQVTNGTYCGGNCTDNTAEFADAYCQIGGYGGAYSFTEQTSGSWGPTWYYNELCAGWLPTSCSDLGWSIYGPQTTAPA